MDSFGSFLAIPFSSTFFIPILLFFLFLVSKFSFSITRNKKRAAPQAGGAWPFIGHLHLLGGPQPAHIVLGNMVEKFGQIFTIKLGVRQSLVVSNWEITKECLTIHDKVFANRPKFVAMDLLGYNYSMFGFAPYGPYWRHVRKIAIVELLSSHRLETFNHVRESALRGSLEELHQLWNKKKSIDSGKALVEMKKWNGDTILNMTLRVIVGKGFSGNYDVENTPRWVKALRGFFELSGKFVVSDAFPILRRLGLDLDGEERRMKKISRELDQVCEEWLAEHKQKRVDSASCVTEGVQDFMDIMLSVLEDTEGRDAYTMIKATCLAMILAGSDTTAVTLTWALSLLLNNRDALRKVQEELDVHVGKDRRVEESDMKNLVYLQVVIKETLRLYPAGPLSLPHESMEDCTVSGYHIPAGTTLFVNIYKIHRDPQVWSNPDEFRPERFLSKDVDFRGQHFEFIPFSGGRRMCPGITFAVQILQLTLANLLQWFDFSTPNNEAIDMSEAVGLTNLKATPIEVFISPRLPASFYELH